MLLVGTDTTELLFDSFGRRFISISCSPAPCVTQSLAIFSLCLWYRLLQHGHGFLHHGQWLYSFDVCGSCEVMTRHIFISLSHYYLSTFFFTGLHCFKSHRCLHVCLSMNVHVPLRLTVHVPLQLTVHVPLRLTVQAQAILIAMQYGISASVHASPTLSQLRATAERWRNVSRHMSRKSPPRTLHELQHPSLHMHSLGEGGEGVRTGVTSLVQLMHSMSSLLRRCP